MVTFVKLTELSAADNVDKDTMLYGVDSGQSVAVYLESLDGRYITADQESAQSVSGVKNFTSGIEVAGEEVYHKGNSSIITSVWDFYEPTDSGFEMAANRAIEFLNARGGGGLTIDNRGDILETTGPIQLRSKVSVHFSGNPTIRLADGVNCNVIETFGYVGAAASGFTDRTDEQEGFSLSGKFVADGNRDNNTSPGAYEGNGIAIFGRDFVLEDVFCNENYRNGCATHYVPSGTPGISPFGCKIERMTIRRSGEHGWLSDVSDTNFAKINVLNSSLNAEGQYDAVHFSRGARGSGITTWRTGSMSVTHRYSINVSSGNLIAQGCSLETGIEGQVYIGGSGGAQLPDLYSYNMIGSGKPHITLAAPYCHITGKIRKGGSGVNNATAVLIEEGKTVNRCHIELAIDSSCTKILDIKGNSGGSSVFQFNVFNDSNIQVIEGNLGTTDCFEYVQIGNAQQSFKKLAAGSNSINASGETQASALASENALIRHQVGRIFSADNSNVAVVMPKALIGLSYIVSNPTPREVSVFPNTGDAFIGKADNEAIVIPSNSTVNIVSDISGRWGVVK